MKLRLAEMSRNSMNVFLDLWSEYIGYLEKFEERRDSLVLHFRGGDAVEIPCKELATKLRGSIGKKISILRTERGFILHFFDGENFCCKLANLQP